MSCWCCVDSLTTWGGEKNCCHAEGGNAGIRFPCKWKLGGESRVGVFASSCRAGEASEWCAGSENSGAGNCKCAYCGNANIHLMSKSPCLFQPFQTGDGKTQTYGLGSTALAHWIHHLDKNIRECVSKCNLNFSQYEVKCFFLTFPILWFKLSRRKYIREEVLRQDYCGVRTSPSRVSMVLMRTVFFEWTSGPRWGWDSGLVSGRKRIKCHTAWLATRLRTWVTDVSFTADRPDRWQRCLTHHSHLQLQQFPLASTKWSLEEIQCTLLP